MAHGVTEATEVMQCHGGADGTKTDGGVAYSFLITLEVNTLNRKCLIELANNLRCSMHQQCLRDFHSFVFNKSLYSPFLCVTFRQRSKLRAVNLITPNY